MEFKPFPKIPRLSRNCVITEKIDGTNASILITPEPSNLAIATINGLNLLAGSRNRWLEPGKDNYGFGNWVKTNAEELVTLGEGHHFGEWWGLGIQRGYNQIKKRFSLFNVHKWKDVRPACCDVVPVLYEGSFSTNSADVSVLNLKKDGSRAAPGYPYPEGIVIYHTAGNLLFKKTLEKDEDPKGIHSGAQRVPEAPAAPYNSPGVA